MRLLLVEDDPMIGESLVRGLRDDAYSVDWVRDGVSALSALRDAQADYALTILDWNLPKRDGLSVLKALRQGGNLVPVLMITARDEIEDRINGLDGGADDYLVKPFALGELKARVRSLLRRHQGRATSEMVYGALVLDPVKHSVTLNGVSQSITAREFALLRILLERPGAVLSRAQIEERMYGWNQQVQSNAVEFTIHSLRRKLGAELIENVRGAGWKLAALR